jgi:hypothetical protein
VLDHIPFALQPVKSAAHRGAAHGKVLRQIRFYNPGSWGEPAVDDEFADVVESLAEAVAVVCFGS